MRDDTHDQVRVVLNEDIEAPIFVHPRLPEASALIVFLGAELGAVQVLQ
jgi:hypothetical protein